MASIVGETETNYRRLTLFPNKQKQVKKVQTNEISN